MGGQRDLYHAGCSVESVAPMSKWKLNIEDDFALLLAATITPNSTMNKMAVADPKVRESAYVEGLSYYLTQHPRLRRFVFVENSGWPLDGIRDAVRPLQGDKQIEFISLDCNRHPEGRPFSIGYGESELMRRGIDASTLIKQTRYFGKITGRLRLLNMTRLLEASPREFQIYCDLQDHHVPVQLVNTSRKWTAVKWQPRHYYQCDTRFFACTLSFYDRHLRRLHDRPTGDEAFWIEGAWFDTIKPMRSDPTVITRFPQQPHYSGMNGTIGFSYDSKKETLKRKFRSVNRALFPWWWL